MVKRIEPEPGQESVWDYPRPPKLVKTEKRVEVVFNGVKIADSVNAYRVLETSHPPAYYIPRDDVQMQYLTSTERRTMCEFKGAASYWTITVEGQSAQNAAWSYESPTERFAPISGYLCFYANLMEACYVDGEQVQAQEGDFYGGWITSDVVGPFKGGVGTWGW
jgi:uncharacterized protein (DUF427 family)